MQPSRLDGWLLIAGIFFLSVDILVYSDGGVGASPECIAMALASLKTFVSKSSVTYTVRTTTSEELKGTTWTNSCRLLVMPGGRDLPYCRELDGIGNANIRSFVEGGGSYLGVCAGAYYGSAFVEFAKGDPNMEVVGPRELAFFPVKAKGPAFPGYSYKSNAGVHAATASITEAGKEIFGLSDETITLLFNGGPFFLPYSGTTTSNCNTNNDRGSPQYTPLLLYTGQSEPTNPDPSWAPAPAMIAGRVGRGKVVLTGLHFEFTAALLKKNDSDDPYITALLPTLEKFEAKRAQLFNSSIAYLLS